MKIAISGTHGTKKTTLAYKLIGYLKEEGYNVGLVMECASQSPMGINEDKGNLESQLWIAHKQMMEELEKEAKYDVVVCDRAIIDSYVYTLDICKRHKKKVPKWYHKMVDEHIKTYDLLFKTQIIKGLLKEDGTRSTSMEWQKSIENLLVKTLKKKKIKYYELPEHNQLGIIKMRLHDYESSKSKN